MIVTAEVLGPIRLSVDGTAVDLGGSRQRRLFAAMLIEIGSVVTADRLIEAVFDSDPPEAAQRTFRTYVARLRRALEVAGLDASRVVVTEPLGYGIPRDAVELDAASFESLLESAQDRLTVGDADGASLTVDEALKLWSGSAYGEFADEDWARVEAVRLNGLRIVARELRARAVLESGRHAVAIPDIEALVDDEPYREEPRRLLMLALYRAGRHADALRAGRAYREFLAEETGLEPSRDLDDLEQLIVAQDPRLEARPHGRKLRGYLLGQPLAETEIGITYRASQPSVGRDVAITAVPPDQADDPSFVRRFEVHAQRIASIEHPNVVPLYDYWREPGGAYLVTRYMRGGSLQDRLVGRSLDHEERLGIIRDVGAALHAAHERGVVHGHLDPSRVLFDEAGTAYVTGFGLDGDRRSTPVDIAAFGALAVELWQGPGEPGGASTGGTTLSRLRVVAALAGGSAGEMPYATISELVGAVEEATLDAQPGSHQQSEPGTSAIEGPNPYRGLFSFNETDSEVFFGRERFVEALLDDLDRHPFLAVVGPSGSGKSSAVRAGLLPLLRANGAFIATMVPGTHPLAELEVGLSRVSSGFVPELAPLLSADPGGLSRVLDEVLPDGTSPVVLVIDQFEEAFTTADPVERDMMLESVGRAVRVGNTRLRVVITARADFLGEILNDPFLGGLVRDHSRLLTPLSAEELHSAVVGPAESAGVAIEPALATTIVSDATRSPGSLPLLQYALTELYEQRYEGTMTLGAYRTMGGLGSVVAQRAEEVYSDAGVTDREATRRLFARLITPGEGVEATRRRARTSELVDVSRSLLATFGKARLVSFDRDPSTREPTVEIAHEALLREWPRLRAWISEDEDGVRLMQHISSSAAGWEASGRDTGELYRGGRLELADEWASSHPGHLSDGERQYLDTSRDSRNAEAELERRTAKRMRRLFAMVAVVAAAAMVASVLAVVQQQSAQNNAAEADLRRVVAESQAAVAGNPNRALLLAIEAHRVDSSIETLGAVQRAVIGSPTNWMGDIDNGKVYRRVGFLPNGDLVATTGATIEVWDLTERVVLRQVSLDAEVADIDLSADGRFIAVGRDDGGWQVLATSDMDEMGSGEADSPATVIRLSVENDLVAIGLADGRVLLRGIDDPSFSRDLDAVSTGGEPVRTPVTDVALRGDGLRVAAVWGGVDHAQQWEVQAADPVGQRLEGSVSSRVVRYVDDVLYTAFIFVSSYDSSTGESLGEPYDLGHGVGANQRLVEADGALLQLVGAGSVTTIDLLAAETTLNTVEGEATSWGGALSPDGRILAMGTSSGLALWSTDGAGLFVDSVVPAADHFTPFNAISANGGILVQGGNISNDIPTLIWDVSGSVPVELLTVAAGKGARVSGDDVTFFEFAAEEDGLAFSSWEPLSNSLQPFFVADPATFGVEIPVTSPDRRRFLHPWNNGQGILDVYDRDSGELLHRLDDVQQAAGSVGNWSLLPVFSPNGEVLIYPTAGEYVALYDANTWELLDLFEPPVGFQHIVFSSDGTMAFTHSSRGLEVRDPIDLRSVLVGPLPGEDDPSFGSFLQITDDGRYLKTSGAGNARLWDPATLAPIGGPFPHDDELWAATLATATNQLATVVDGATIVWNVDLDTWPDLACLAAGRNLTRSEWEEFGPAGEYHATCDQWPAL